VTPLLLCKPRDPSAGSCRDLAYGGAESSGYVEEHGLGDRHYADVNRREHDYHEYLVARERNLHRRNRRIEQDTSQLLSRPVVGSAAEVTCLRKKATALATYVPLPISPKEQIGRILASYRNPGASLSVAALHTP
jgi:hypothetical protein